MFVIYIFCFLYNSTCSSMHNFFFSWIERIYSKRKLIYSTLVTSFNTLIIYCGIRHNFGHVNCSVEDLCPDALHKLLLKAWNLDHKIIVQQYFVRSISWQLIIIIIFFSSLIVFPMSFISIFIIARICS